MIKAREIKQNFLKFFNNIKKQKTEYEIQFDEILSLHQKSSTNLIALIISVLCLFPIPGMGTFLGSFLVLLSFGFLFSYQITIPEKIRKMSFPHKISKSILISFFHMWSLIAKHAKPRIPIMSHEATKILWFFNWLLMCALIIMPIPFGNFLPSITMIVFLIGWILKDGLLLAATPILSIVSFIPFVLSIELVINSLKSLGIL